MAEESNRSTSQKDSHRIPAWSWPYIFGIFMLGYPVLFYDNRTLRTEIKDANQKLIDAKDKALEDRYKDNAAIRRQNEFLTRLLYTSENMAKFLYTDSVVLATRAAATKNTRAGDTGNTDTDRPN